jgi:NAD(P)H-flavin reductase
MTPKSLFSFFSPTSDKSLLSSTSATNLILSPEDKPLPAKPKGLTFFMRTHTGTTGLLRKRTSLPVLVEASYGAPRNFKKYPLLICVAGGVGITAILPYLHVRRRGSAKLYWGCRSTALVNSLREDIRGYGGEILVGRRLFIKLALQREFAEAGEHLDVAVVVSGPKGMADDARELCCEMAKRRSGDVMFVDENFGW